MRRLSIGQKRTKALIQRVYSRFWATPFSAKLGVFSNDDHARSSDLAPGKQPAILVDERPSRGIFALSI
jgi:hypothetical protein